MLSNLIDSFTTYAGLAVTFLQSEQAIVLLRYAGYVAGGSLAAAVAGKAIERAGQATHIRPLELIGTGTFKVAEAALKVVLVPPVAVLLGIKWFIVTGVPKGLNRGIDFIAWVLPASVNAAGKVAVKLYEYTIQPFVSLFQRNSGRMRRALLAFSQAYIEPIVQKAVKAINWSIAEIFGPAFIYATDFLAFVVFELCASIFFTTLELIRLTLNKSVDGTIFCIESVFVLFYNLVIWPILWSLDMIGEGVSRATRFTVDYIVIPILHGIETAATWLATRVIVPSWNFIIDKVIVPTLDFIGRSIVWLGTKFVDGVTWLFNRIIIPFFDALGRAAVWLGEKIVAGFTFFVERILIPFFNAVGRAIVWLVDKTVAGFTFLVQRVIVPFFDAVGAAVVWLVNKTVDLAMWVFQRVIVPVVNFIGFLLEKIVNGVVAAVSFIVNRILVPLADFVVLVVAKLAAGIAAAAVWFWTRVLYPLVMLCVNVVVSIATTIARVAQWFWWSILHPTIMFVFDSVLALARGIAALVTAVVVPVGRAVGSLVAAVATVVGQVVAAVAGIIAGIVGSVGNIVGGVAGAVWRIVGGG